MPRHANKTQRPSASNAGFSLLYVIAVIAALSTLAASIASLTGTGLVAELNESFATRARYIALAGFNYARQFKEDYDELEYKTFTMGQDKFYFSDYRQFQDSTGIMRVEFKVTGTAAAGTPQEANYVVYDNFESQDQGAITSQNMDVDWPNFKPNATSDLAMVKNNDGTFTIGNNQNNAFGSFIYTGTKTLNWGHNNCTAGLCDFQEGIRLFFISYYEASAADGIVFVLMNSDNNTIYSVGGDSQHGEMIGYAADGRIYSGGGYNADSITWLSPNQKGIQPPKIGIEFDNYKNEGTGALCATNPGTSGPITGQRADGTAVVSGTSTFAPHISYDFWGKDSWDTSSNTATSGTGYGFDCAYCRRNTVAATNMTNGSQAFDGTTSQNRTNSAYSSASPGYIGKDFGPCKSKIITGWNAWGSNDRGFTEANDSSNVTISLYGSNSNSYASATLISGSEKTFTDTTAKVSHTFSNAYSYRYYWLKIVGATKLYVAEAQFLETVTAWGTTFYPIAYEPYESTDCSQATTWEGVLAYDDNRHGWGDNLSNTEFWKSTSYAWGNNSFAYRAEIERKLTPETSGPGIGKYAYRITSWVRMCNTAYGYKQDCLQYVNATGSTTEQTNRAYFSDTSRFLCAHTGTYTDSTGTTRTDYSKCSVANPPILDKTIFLTPSQHEQFNEMIFGFTEATGGSTQKATYSYFTLQFMKPNDWVTDSDGNPTDTKRRVINRVIN
jgi:hypothetical protein